MFLPGIMWKFLSYIPITVFSTLLAALILSLTLSSALFFKLTKKKNYFHKDHWFEERLSASEKDFLLEQRKGKEELKTYKTFRNRVLSKLWNKYYNVLNKFLSSKKSRMLSIFIPILVLIFTFVFLSPRIWFTLFPSTDEWVITISLEAKTWTDKKALEKYLEPIDKSLSSYPEINVYNTSISWNRLSVDVNLLSRTERKDKGMRNVFEIEKLITNDISYLVSDWLKLSVDSLKWWPPTWDPVWVKLIASDNKKVNILREVASDFEDFLRNIEWTKNVWVSSSDNPGQFVFKFDREKLAFIGLNPDDILWEVYYYTSWVKAGSIKSNIEDNDIVLKIKDFDEKLTPEDIENLVVNTRVWKVRVWDYADFTFDKSLSSINREDGRIIISVGSSLEFWVVPTKIQPKLIDFAKSYKYPSWISFLAGWENEENKELIISTFKSLFIALFLIFTILVFQFNSYSQPAIILYSVVLALLWVNIWLFITWNPYSMPFAIWFIALTWVVVNDAIILVDRINKNIDKLVENTKRKLVLDDYLKAIVEWWKNRLQPIIVTTLTTIFWVLPLALQDGFWAGLGFTIIFGLFAGSSMTLFVIPALYYSIYLRKKIKNIK